MPITLPSNVAPNELIASAWGNSVVDALDELDTEKIDKAGGTFTGLVAYEASLVPTSSNHLTDKGYVDTTFVPLAGGTMTGTLNGTAIAMSAGITAVAAIRAGNPVVATTTVGSAINVGSVGQILSVVSAASNSILLNRAGAGAADGEAYMRFSRTNGDTTIGSITIASAGTAVAYNTTSDARLKEDVGLSADDGIETVLRFPVRRFRREGGSEGVGMFAQEMSAVVPGAVIEGGDDPYKSPWLMAYADENIIGHLALSVQQLTARLAELEKKPKK